MVLIVLHFVFLLYANGECSGLPESYDLKFFSR